MNNPHYPVILLLTLILAGGLGSTPALSLPLSESHSVAGKKNPIEITSERMRSENQNRKIIFSGNVKSQWGDLEIKSDVLGIAAELGNLEERLLYPSHTQVAVFVALERDDGFRLDAVQIELNGEQASHHIYSFKELEAMQKGGVQRIYTGNVVRPT